MYARLGDSDRDKNKDRYPATDDHIANRYQPSDGKNEFDTRAPTKHGNQNGNHGMYAVLVVISYHTYQIRTHLVTSTRTPEPNNKALLSRAQLVNLAPCFVSFVDVVCGVWL